MNDNAGYAIDIKCKQKKKFGQHVFGDTFLFKKIQTENRWIAVLSDGLGSGVKANVLSILTATMAMKFIAGFKDIKKSAEIIMKTLPVCSERKISYATFTIVDIDGYGNVQIVNYDNPPFILLRKGKLCALTSDYVDGVVKGRPYSLGFTRFTLIPDDRIILISDGITQAGMGTPRYPLGWGNDAVADFVGKRVAKEQDITAKVLSSIIVDQSYAIDNYKEHDDATCSVIHCRIPLELLLVSGPPVDRERDKQLAEIVCTFNGKTIVCGGTTAKIIARELDRPISLIYDALPSPLPPQSKIDGIDLVTEGIITLHLVESILDEKNHTKTTFENPAQKIVDLLLESDRIHFVLGTRINEAWQDPDLPDDFGLRRTIIARIRRLLETNYQKEVKFIAW